MSAQLILASASPRRRELLQQLGIDVIAQAVDIDETQKPDEQAIVFVERLALEKAKRGYETIPNKMGLPVLGSDTVVELEGKVLGKPESRQDARQMLQKLSSKKHTVHTSVAIVNAEKSVLLTSSSQVTFMSLDEQTIEQYLLTGEADDKAGSYAIQGIAAQFVVLLEGSYSGVMGLPLYETTSLLKQFGIATLPEA